MNESYLPFFFSSLISEHYLKARFIQLIDFGFFTVQGDSPQQDHFPPMSTSAKGTYKLKGTQFELHQATCPVSPRITVPWIIIKNWKLAKISYRVAAG